MNEFFAVWEGGQVYRFVRVKEERLESIFGKVPALSLVVRCHHGRFPSHRIATNGDSLRCCWQSAFIELWSTLREHNAIVRTSSTSHSTAPLGLGNIRVFSTCPKLTHSSASQVTNETFQFNTRKARTKQNEKNSHPSTVKLLCFHKCHNSASTDEE